MWSTKRSYKKELIDGDLSFEELKVNLNELDVINNLLGGYRISLSAIKNLNQPVTGIADIGCGGGHFLLKFKETLPNSLVVGIDLKKECIHYAQEVCSAQDIQLIRSDYREVLNNDEIDLVHACLFFHHFEESDIIEFLKGIRSRNKTLIINDLERNFLAWIGIKILTTLFSRSRLVKNDAPLSVKRGFKKKEWIDMLHKAGISKYSIKNKWAFRHQIILYGEI